jgi:hypothetical protein
LERRKEGGWGKARKKGVGRNGGVRVIGEGLKKKVG